MYFQYIDNVILKLNKAVKAGNSADLTKDCMNKDIASSAKAKWLTQSDM